MSGRGRDSSYPLPPAQLRAKSGAPLNLNVRGRCAPANPSFERVPHNSHPVRLLDAIKHTGVSWKT